MFNRCAEEPAPQSKPFIVEACEATVCELLQLEGGQLSSFKKNGQLLQFMSGSNWVCRNNSLLVVGAPSRSQSRQREESLHSPEHWPKQLH